MSDKNIVIINPCDDCKTYNGMISANIDSFVYGNLGSIGNLFTALDLIEDAYDIQKISGSELYSIKGICSECIEKGDCYLSIYDKEHINEFRGYLKELEEEIKRVPEFLQEEFLASVARSAKLSQENPVMASLFLGEKIPDSYIGIVVMLSKKRIEDL